MGSSERGDYASWLHWDGMLSFWPLTGCPVLFALQRRWYQTDSEYYLLQFTLTVRCLYYTSFSLEFCGQQLPATCASHSFPWMLAYVFYYPVFHNGPILNFPEFFKQVGDWTGSGELDNAVHVALLACMT